MVLSAREESLIDMVRSLPPEEADKVLNWAHQLGEGRNHLGKKGDSA